MNYLMNQTSIKEKLESFLDRACQAEEAGNNAEAGRLFRFALRCEELSQSEISGTAKNAQQATPANGDSKLLIKLEIQENNHVTQNKNV